MPEDIQNVAGHVADGDHAGADRVVEIVIDVGNDVGEFEHLPFERCGDPRDVAGEAGAGF